MAFCTQCGASVEAAFCTRCGTAAGQAQQQPAPRRKTSPIAWVLVAVLCLFGMGLIGLLGAGAFVLHKARRAGVDAELFRTNPGLAIGKMIAATHPALEVVDTDGDAGVVTLRDRHSGKRFTITFDDARQGRFSLRAVGDDGRSGSVEFGEGARLPSWVPRYPGSSPTPVFSARGDSDHGAGEAGDFTFDTDDPPSKVLEFYKGKARELGMEIHNVDIGDGLSLAASDDG